MSEQAKVTAISQRKYVGMISVHPSYIGKLIRRGMPANSDGSINPALADAWRKRYTVAGKGQKRWQRRHGIKLNEQAACLGCGELYGIREAATPLMRSPDARKFCTDACAADVAAGLSRTKIRRKIRHE